METTNDLLKAIEDENLEEIKGLPPSTFKDFGESDGWLVIRRILASWISLRRDNLESQDAITDEDRMELIGLQREIRILRAVISLPDALEVDSKMEKKDAG